MAREEGWGTGTKEFREDLTQATTWQDFIAALNEGFIRQVAGEWKGNLDAFNDYLYRPEEHP